MPDEPAAAWLAALDERHLADLTPSEVARALRALSSCYVERRARLAGGGALESAGKRAAFALFYAPLHFAVVRAIVGALPGSAAGLDDIVDVGCGTGAAGAAWAGQAGANVQGFDRNPWAIAEANWTYRQLGLRGRARQSDVSRVTLASGDRSATLLSYTVNELTDQARDALLPRLLAAHARGGRALIVEPIARRTTPWWSGWERAVRACGGRSDEWRFPASLGDRQLSLARAAGLDPREMTARSLYLPA